MEKTPNQNNSRLEILFKKHNEWLRKVAYNFCKNTNESEELVGELYLYLAERGNPKLYYLDSFNLQYCRSFIKTRWLNKAKRDSKSVSKTVDKPLEEYDIESDVRIQDAYDSVLNELNNLKKTNLWSSARLFEIYFFEGGTMQEVSQRIGVSNSTTFSKVKTIKQYLKQNINNPFNE